MRRCLRIAGLFFAVGAVTAAVRGDDARRNVVFILTDDQRFDALSLLGHPFLETPNLDRLAAEGILFENAFVTTSLCSPSRASILTGQYAHRHGVLANRERLDPAIPAFPALMQEEGYETAFIGKWHMGAPDASPRPGFDHWVSFPGQGVYTDQAFNVDGERVETEGYTTDVITDYAVEFLRRERDGPFLLYVSHKAVHAPFTPAPRHQGSYRGERYPYPATMADTEENYEGKPDWVRAQRRSWHGVDGMYAGRVDMDRFVVDYAETLRAVDEGVGRLLEELERLSLLESTVVVFTSDNGFQFGEHGLIDKRTMYEASIRVPLLVYAPGLASGGERRSEMILNIDFAPTFMELAGAEIPQTVQGRSFLGLLRGETRQWRDAFLYEYFWENAFPQTPTVFGIRTDRYKLMRYHGVWDLYELYDLEEDPEERHNLLADYRTRTEVGNVEARVLGAPTPEAAAFLGSGTDDDGLRALFLRLWTRLEELVEEAGATTRPIWEKRD